MQLLVAEKLVAVQFFLVAATGLQNTIFYKQNKRINNALNNLHKHFQEKKLHSTLCLTQKGIYTIQACELARLMVSTGTVGAKVGETLQEIGKSFGINIQEKMSKRMV